MSDGWNEYGRLKKVAMRHVCDAFVGQDNIDRQWHALNFSAAPDFDAAVEEFDTLASVLESAGIEIVWLPGGPGLTLDSLYVRDATLISPVGLISCAMGKKVRAAEPTIAEAAFGAQGLPVPEAIGDECRIEGGDVVWFDRHTVAVGQGYRTDADGIGRLRARLGGDVDLVVVPLPHYRGPQDVFHLMSMISPLDADLALVHSPLLPVPFRDWLLGRGIELVDVAEDEFDTLGCNALALGPRRVLMAEGNPLTETRLETAGCEIATYPGREISLMGGGGPTCLTRPLVRS